MLDFDTLRVLPKIDLHRHLEGSLRPETLWEFHCREKQSVHASFEALKAVYMISHGTAPGFQNYLSRFSAIRFRFGEIETLERIAAEAVDDAAADGIIHLELRFSPVGFARRINTQLTTDDRFRTEDPITNVEQAATAIVRGARREAAKHGMSLAFIVTLGRHFGVHVNRPAGELLTSSIGTELSALDLAGEESYSMLEFLDIFNAWKKAGRGITIHAGEDPHGAGAQNVRQALDQCKASRIGHGVRAVEDPALLTRLAKEEVALEVCLTSNIQTHTCASYETHPIGKLLLAGVRVTLNTDNPVLNGITLSREYANAIEHCGLDGQQLKHCVLNAARSAYLSDAEKTILIQRIELGWKQIDLR